MKISDTWKVRRTEGDTMKQEVMRRAKIQLNKIIKYCELNDYNSVEILF